MKVVRVKKTKNNTKVIVLKKAKDHSKRDMGGCSLPALVITIPVRACD